MTDGYPDAYLGLTKIVEDDDEGDLISRALDRISHFHGISIGEFMRQAIARQQSCPDVPHLNSKPNLRHSAVKTLVDIGKIAFGVFVGIKLSNAELRRRSH